MTDDVKQRLVDLEEMEYEEFLESPEWHVLRLAALSAALERCNVCGGSVGLQVHHRDYHDGRKAWHNLTVLCRDCHERHHGKKSELQQRLEEASRRDDIVAVNDLLRSILDAARKHHGIVDEEGVGG
jgi:hypothetical protein